MLVLSLTEQKTLKEIVREFIERDKIYCQSSQQRV